MSVVYRQRKGNTMTLDWKEYEALAREAVTEGVVLLKNDNSVLPLKKDSRLAVFGRMQNNYYKSGTGSGGMVNVPKVWSIVEGLQEESMSLNEELLEIYKEFEKTHPFDPGVGFEMNLGHRRKWKSQRNLLRRFVLSQM